MNGSHEYFIKHFMNKIELRNTITATERLLRLARLFVTIYMLKKVFHRLRLRTL